MIDLHDPESWQAGRELDAKLAEIMGWKDLSRNYGIKPGTVINRFADYHEIPKFSTSYQGAGLMLEWGHGHGFVFECMIGQDLSNIKIRDNETFFFVADGESDKLPEAIARAILAWQAQQEGVEGRKKTKAEWMASLDEPLD